MSSVLWLTHQVVALLRNLAAEARKGPPPMLDGRTQAVAAMEGRDPAAGMSISRKANLHRHTMDLAESMSFHLCRWSVRPRSGWVDQDSG